ncbi:MAG: hypothetical protein RMN53_03315 [Anaerolineae bacterium]|nr:hypothetical protein [Anaerolineae bacterium]
MATDSIAHLVSTAPSDRQPATVPLVLALSADTAEAEQGCPNCRRSDALVAIGEMTFCLACGYSSEGGRGCT